ncbi:MaoC family dehydratase [Roseibium alexandrii]|uniref:Acyl dehydratase n=1 Tax=Roseibium alexandrii (strain DSM 17067 / NCIMB 14079 / DFL-11) TaxID=244592 RepID=A0A5E8H396_ROSAD|nr:MaoC family dehydratase [Roseibium alexandrii]EEE47115.1 Acyl dehydratase [Roseibium alexandrii DFL-11]
MIPDLDRTDLPVEALSGLVGKEVGVSSWHRIDQVMIDAFADVTKDHQHIHVDPAAAASTPFGGTIAHGFLTLSLLSVMGLEAQPKIRGMTMGINYGFNRVRFLNPVKSGARIRGQFVLKEVKALKPSELDITWASTVEIEDESRPALSADWLNRFYLEIEAA